MKPDRTSAPPRRRPGGRSARVVRAVLDATLDSLARTGYAALSFEEVAARAGVSRTTVYRRWPAKPDLVRAALLRFAEQHGGGRDTGTLRGDLLDGLTGEGSGERLARGLPLLRAMLGEMDDPELRALAHLAFDRAHQPAVAAIERAVARGELPAGTDPEAVLEPIVFTALLRRAIFGEEGWTGLVERVVDVVLAGARAGAAVRGARR